MTKSDYEKLPEYVNEQEALESWITSLVESKELPTITKGNFIKTIKENLDGDVDSPYTIGTESQKDSFEYSYGYSIRNGTTNDSRSRWV